MDFIKDIAKAAGKFKQFKDNVYEKKNKYYLIE